MSDPDLVNAVGGGDLNQELDLNELQKAIEGEEVRYEPEYWPGLYIRFNVDSPAILIFGTGKYNIAGADSVDELIEANNNIISYLKKIGINVSGESFEVRNLVLSDKYKRELNLDTLCVSFGLEVAEYEPEQFPGILYDKPGVTGLFMIFRSGSVLMTGGKNEETARSDFEDFFDELDSFFE